MGSFCFLSFFLLSSLLVTTSARPLAGAGGVVINEVYYDHPGTDTGHEFVELYNGSDAPVTLDGVTLEFHNGNGTGWSLLWSGSALDTVPASGVFTVGASLVAPSPDVVIALSLQNGPDAVGIFRDGAALDLVGYGGLDDVLYVEQTGADAVAAGQSIARIPDGADTDDNRSDFSAAAPTPGRTNLARHDAALELGARTEAAGVDDDGFVDVSLEVVNAGTASIAAAAVSVLAVDSTGDGALASGPWSNAAEIAPGGREALDVTLALDPGTHRLEFTAAYARDERAHNDAVRVLRRVGTPPLLVSEVLSSPPPGCPQFVELYNAGGLPVSIAGYGLRDRSHAPVPVAPGDAVVDPGAFVVLTPDAAALAARFDVPTARVFGVEGSWPTINRTGGEVADSVVIVDADGLPVDAVAVPGMPASAAGRSLERVDLYRTAGGATWVLCADARGATPGRSGSRVLLAPPPPGAVVARPNPFVPGVELLTIAIDAPAGSRAVVTVFDARGRRVAAVGVASAFPAVLVWNGADDAGRTAMPGLYVLACEIDDGAAVRVVREVIGCAPR